MPGKPAAKNMDTHICPKPQNVPTTPPPPHGPGTIQASGASKVFVNGLPAAVQGDTCLCVAEPGNSIKSGSQSVYFGNKQAARQLDQTTHFVGGTIQSGSANVFIGG